MNAHRRTKHPVKLDPKAYRKLREQILERGGASVAGA